MIDGILIYAVFTLSAFVMGSYTVVARWWLHRAGRAYMILFASLFLLSGFFLFERLTVQQAEWAQSTVIGLVAAAIAFNGYVIISKQIRAWRIEHPNTREPEGL